VQILSLRLSSQRIIRGLASERRDEMSPTPDLGAVFDEHVANEFVAKDLDATMQTMTDDPYVWHVPPLTGASGAEAVRAFYGSQFIGHTPADAVLVPISRTVAADRVIDEFVLEFTHDIELPWMLPGVAPTGRRVRIPTVVVMGFDGDKVAYGHIYWDQASVLVQIGLLDPGALPVSGAEQAERLLELAGAAGA
jgi:carboxymethylenebutenolidase